MLNEEWRDAIGFEGTYEVSSEGRVRGVDRILEDGRKWKGRILRPSSSGGGYLQVSLSLHGVRNVRHVHSLVAEAFIGKRPDGWQVRHLNGNRTDNRAENLAIGTASENMQDAVRHRTHSEVQKTHCIRGHPLEAPNLRPLPNARACLACGRAHSRVRYYPHLRPHLQEVSDSYYQEIIKEFVNMAHQ